MLIETYSEQWKNDVSAGYRELFKSYDKIPWRWFVTVSFPRPISFEELESRIQKWIKKVEKLFDCMVCALGLMVKGNGSCHAHVVCFGQNLVGDLTQIVDGAGEITRAGKKINEAKRFWTEQNKPTDPLKIMWSENFIEDYIEVKSTKTSKKIAVTPEQKEFLKKRANGNTQYVIVPKYSKESSVIPEKDGPLPDFVSPARETSIDIKPVYNVFGLMEYFTKPKNLQIQRNEHSEVFVFRDGFLKQLKRRYQNA
jgi:hypothetical protein